MATEGDGVGSSGDRDDSAIQAKLSQPSQPAPEGGAGQTAVSQSVGETKPRPGRIKRVRLWLKANPRTVGEDWKPAYRGPVEDATEGTVGICCSGGGIRSASFNLGALQRLDEEGVLRDADYLAAVSGGSYMAAAYAIVSPAEGYAEAPAGGPFGYVPAAPDPSTPRRRLPRPFAAGSPEEQYLRNRTGYMAPSGMSALIFLWRFVIGALMTYLLVALPIALGTFVLTEAIFEPLYYPDRKVDIDLDIPGEVYWGTLGILGAAALASMFSMFESLPRRVLETWGARLVIIAALTALVAILLPLTREALASPGENVSSFIGGISISAATLTFLGGALALVREVLVPREEPSDRGRSKILKPGPGLASRLRLGLAYFAGTVAGPLLIGAGAYGALSLALDNEWSRKWMLIVCLPLALLYLLAYRVTDLTALSLHRVYRRRLSSAFALERKRVGDEIYVVPRDAEKIKLSETPFHGRDDAHKPALIVCAAANVSDEGATPRGREVTSFTFSASSVGGPLVGVIPTADLEEGSDADDRAHDVTLPAAVAMSGAALAPSMGKLTRKPFRFLLCLANVRLGVWVPNPQWARDLLPKRRQEPKYQDRLQRAREGSGKVTVGGVVKAAGRGVAKVRRDRGFGRPRPSYLLRELLGSNYLNSPYLYVTDGGHYENLGLVELLRRGCTEIYCFDASAGKNAQALGDAIAMARSELRVEVEIDPSAFFGAFDPRRTCVTGTIRYPATATASAIEGRLYYCKNVMRKKASWDVVSLAERDPAFPDHSTAEQLFVEQRFEGYRKLGWDAATDAIALREGVTQSETADVT